MATLVSLARAGADEGRRRGESRGDRGTPGGGCSPALRSATAETTERRRPEVHVRRKLPAEEHGESDDTKNWRRHRVSALTPHEGEQWNGRDGHVAP
ncbi:hypothetical protein BESB_031410 [Besnoitia besnoiti]|uniref:Uncharacterized protein n=1 Tax=Besnoitia besnoiti TaxID=94643 RepID=A0A2A9M6K7_BESBE|nr:hypothetical protein BESB_031410 [Besnoitia besnoiti]PFH31267.1 hypothetical protein BESB_031410 [Besnoitia besnoiti]